MYLDIDGMGKPSSMSASPEKEAPEEDGEKSGGGGSLKGSDWSRFQRPWHILSVVKHREELMMSMVLLQQS